MPSGQKSSKATKPADPKASSAAAQPATAEEPATAKDPATATGSANPATATKPARPKSSTGEKRAAAAPVANDSLHFSRFTEFDIHLFREGKHHRLYDKLGSHEATVDGAAGTYFAVWAPAAQEVSVIGQFNDWSRGANPLSARWDSSGIWEGFVPDIGHGVLYKYAIRGAHGGDLEKADPFARYCELPPNTASIVWHQDTRPYAWQDEAWMKERHTKNGLQAPMSVYELHVGSWRKRHGGTESLSYRELADELVPYIQHMGFTHVEMMPVMEHPYFPSWGYQVLGYFAPTSRFGVPEDFACLVDRLHQAGIGVILDWVPSHFPEDAFGLHQFDGTHLFDHADERKGYHPDWKSRIFNYGRPEVKSFLISNALFWLDQYHADGLRVDAVASMLYLDYSRQPGGWEPNIYGGNENLEAIAFLQEFNAAVYQHFPDTATIAEESTSYSGVSKPVYAGGLGFGQKWMMGWMHDTLKYFAFDPIYRKYHHNQLTFSAVYKDSENFMLPLSHDEVVYGKGSLFTRMPGDEWQKFANLRLLFGYMYTHPGTKLLFMGGEFGQPTEWSLERGLDWSLLDHGMHQGIAAWVKAVNEFYRDTPAMHERQFEPGGFQWIEGGDAEGSTLSYLRWGHGRDECAAVVHNLTPLVRSPYRIGLPSEGRWEIVLNSDEKRFGGSGVKPRAVRDAEPTPWQGQPYSLELKLPPLATVVMVPLGM